jgi:hypothetical protein
VKSNVEASTSGETPDPQTNLTRRKIGVRLAQATDYNLCRHSRKRETLFDVADKRKLIPQPVPFMNSPKHELISSAVSSCTPAEAGSQGLLLSRDLIFTTKINATAAGLGYRIRVARDAMGAESLIAEQRPQVVLIDLTAGDLCSESALRAYRKLAGPEVWFVAFGPHVDGDALAAAKAAGCQIAMTRSKFTAELPELMHQYLS